LVLSILLQYNLVQPVTLSRSITTGTPLVNPLLPHVQPQYYGGLVIAEAVGTSGSSSVIELSINDAYVSGYAIYENGSLVRAVLINSLSYFATDASAGKARPSTHIALSGVSGKATVRRLSIAHADDTSNVKWAGQSFETRDGRASGSLVETTINVTNGVDISATEAVLITFA
jgi:hypothetical protein